MRTAVGAGGRAGAGGNGRGPGRRGIGPSAAQSHIGVDMPNILKGRAGGRGVLRLRGLRFLAAVAILSGAGCSVLSPDNGAQHELDRNRDRWEDRASEHQQYTLQQTVMCFCPNAGDAHEVRVVGDSITAVRNLASGEQLPPDQWQLFRTVDALFDMVQRAIDEADSFEVTYHPIHGYPAAISIDYITNAVDDEIAVRTELLQ